VPRLLFQIKDTHPCFSSRGIGSITHRGQGGFELGRGDGSLVDGGQAGMLALL